MPSVVVEIDWDSGPYSKFRALDGPPLPGRRTVTVPKDLWDRYEAAQCLASDLERQIEDFVVT